MPNLTPRRAALCAFIILSALPLIYYWPSLAQNEDPEYPRPRIVTRGPSRQFEDSVDAVQNVEIRQLQQQTAANSADINKLTLAVNDLTVQIKTYTIVIQLIGLSFGGILTVLQVIQILYQRKQTKRRRRYDRELSLDDHQDY